MGRIRIGTCSWSDRSLISSGWYPKNASDSQSRLRFYAENFSTVEADSTFYAIPAPETVYAWAARTPPDFRFNIKVFGLFTFHKVNFSALPGWLRKELPEDTSKKGRISFADIPKSLRNDLWRQFTDVVKPLHQMGKLGYLLYQLPPWAGYSERMMKYLEKTGQISPPMRAAVEVRNNSWLHEYNKNSFLDLLKDYNMAYVIVDEPGLDWTVPPEVCLTATWGSVIRFHGRNRETWSQKGASVQERFRYRYSEEELIPWKNSIVDIVTKVETVYGMFNNCYRNYSVRNAMEMEVLLGLKKSENSYVQQDLGL